MKRMLLVAVVAAQVVGISVARADRVSGPAPLRLAVGGGLRVGVPPESVEHLDLMEVYGYSRFMNTRLGINADLTYRASDRFGLGVHAGYGHGWGGSSERSSDRLGLGVPELGLYGRVLVRGGGQCRRRRTAPGSRKDAAGADVAP